MAPIIETRQLRHVYGAGTPFEHCAVDGIDFRVERGEFLGLIGHTGSGKSTLIQHLNGLLKPTEGQVLIGGLIAAGMMRNFGGKVPNAVLLLLMTLACVLGGIAYFICARCGLSTVPSGIICGIVVFLMRILAVKYRLHLPTLKGEE